MLNIQALVQFFSTHFNKEKLINNAASLIKYIFHNLTATWQELMTNTSNNFYSRIVLVVMVIINFSYVLLLSFRIARQFNRQSRKLQKRELE